MLLLGGHRCACAVLLCLAREGVDIESMDRWCYRTLCCHTVVYVAILSWEIRELITHVLLSGWARCYHCPWDGPPVLRIQKVPGDWDHLARGSSPRGRANNRRTCLASGSFR